MKKTIATFLAVSALALSVQAQTTVGVTTSNTLVQGSNAQVKGQYVTIDAASAIILKSPSITSSGSISTSSSVTAAKGYIQGMDVGNELINIKDSVVRNAAASVDRDNGIKDSLTVINNNVSNLGDTVVQNNTVTNGRIDVTNDALATEVTRAKGIEAGLQATKADKVAVAAAISAEENARIAGDIAVLNGAKSYTDSKIVNQSASDRAYTDKAVTGERDRAMAAEAALSKETKQVGAMAMAAAGVAGATPVGDKKTAATVALGSYSGQTAIAVGVSHLIKENTRVFGAFSKVSGGKTGVTVGASFSF